MNLLFARFAMSLAMIAGIVFAALEPSQAQPVSAAVEPAQTACHIAESSPDAALASPGRGGGERRNLRWHSFLPGMLR